MPHSIFKLLTLLVFSFSAFAVQAFAAEKPQNIKVNADFYREVKNLISELYVEDVNEEDFIYNSLNGGLTGMDPHSAYFSPKDYAKFRESIDGEFAGIGVQIISDSGFIKVISPIDGTPAFKAGIKSGDYITHINGENIYSSTVEEASSKIKGKEGSKVKLVIIRGGLKEPLELTLTREKIKNKSVTAKLVGEILIVRISNFISSTSNEFKEEISKHKYKGIVIDVRNNPGGILDEALAISDFFLSEGEAIVTIRTRLKSGNQPSLAKSEADISCDKTGKACKKILVEKTQNETTFVATKNTIVHKDVPIIVLINKASASASEIVAAAMQDNKRATIIGERSFGKGVVQNIIPIVNGEKGAIKITTARYYGPNKNPIQAEGVTPDILVPSGKIEVSENKFVSLFSQREEDLKNHTTSEVLKTQAQGSEKYKKDEDFAKEYYEDLQMFNAIIITKSKISQ